MLSTLYPWQAKQWQQFSQQKQQQRLPHALLLSGTKGLGKEAFANAIINSVLCQSPNPQGEACGQCHSCQLFVAGTHPDHIDIKPEAEGKQIKVDQVRELKSKQQLTSTVSIWKTVLISPADAMNISSANSLLKLLEEPQSNTLLILVTEQIAQLPVTIRSRCQSIHLSSPSQNDALAWLNQQGLTANDTDKQTVLELAQGAPLLAAAMLNDETLLRYQQIEQDFKAIVAGTVNPVSVANSWKDDNLLVILQQLQHQLKQRLLTNHHNKVYWQIYDCIMNTNQLTSTSNNFNNTLIIEDFIVSIMTLVSNSKR